MKLFRDYWAVVICKHESLMPVYHFHIVIIAVE